MNNIFPKTSVRRNSHGQGLFLDEFVRKGQPVLRQRGQLVHGLDDFTGDIDDLTQIGKNLWISSSYEEDDFLNHSCDPNVYQVMDETGATDYALRDIAPGEEITFDYSLAMTPESIVMFPKLRFFCKCKSKICRGIVGDVTEIPKERREYYQSLGIVPDYIQKYIK